MTKEELSKMRMNVNAKMLFKTKCHIEDFKHLLDEEEKEYIKWLVKGYENEVLGIKKEQCRGVDYILIVPKNVDDLYMEDYNYDLNFRDRFVFPVVRVVKHTATNPCYEGMVYNKIYTFEELEILI